MNDDCFIGIGDDEKIIFSSLTYFKDVNFYIYIDGRLIFCDPNKEFVSNMQYWFLPDNKSYLNNDFVVKVTSNDNSNVLIEKEHRHKYLPFDLDYIKKKYEMETNGAIVVGAHYGNENKELEDFKNKIFFEPQPDAFEILKKNIIDKNSMLVNKAVGNVVGKIKMNVEKINRGQSSSILKPYKHLYQYPWITFDEEIEVDIIRLNNYPVDRKNYNFMLIDVQGYELEVLKGASELLRDNIDYIITEVNRDELYENCSKVEDLDNFLSNYNFIRVETDWGGDTWGDALYIKDKRKISLAITTYNRIDFTLKSFEKIYDDKRISEIVIVDDCSNIENFEMLRNKIAEIYGVENSKIKLFRNEENIGTGENKKMAISLCENDWVIILDSDNNIDRTYIDCLYKMVSWSGDVIYCPSKAGDFDYSFYNNTRIGRKLASSLIEDDKRFQCLLNNCNYFVNKKEYLKIQKHSTDVKSLDGIFFNYHWLKNNKEFFVVPDLIYEHVVHSENRWTIDKEENEKMLPDIIKKIKDLKISKIYFDIGVNEGFYTRNLFLSKPDDVDLVVCVDPNPISIDMLEFNLSDYKNNVAIVKKAVSSDKSNYIDFYVCNRRNVISTCDLEWIEHSRFSKRIPRDEWIKTQVETTTIDQLVEEYGEPIEIKIDVEGYDLNVIKSMKKYYEGCKISFEWSEEKYLETIGAINYLHRLGYKDFHIQMEDKYDYEPSEYLDYFEVVKKLNEVCVFDRCEMWGMIHVK